ncbi:hypothetical protein [Natronospira bacteriovora]|uniref:Lipoprotein n=1 Tax=Natronospira bacteriovora TaxID=3069753 RepID=A0ABU0W315_9GAMM|nr:hypothetical protein [Natronospira sp. AB-CW4]MDQ2068404.1 hypothetical protein [Natronospira sp. AB-CW4]
MDYRILVSLTAVLFLLSGCFSSSSSDSDDASLSDRDRAAAAASASVLSGALDDPTDDDDDDDDGDGSASRGSMMARLQAAMATVEECEDGGTREFLVEEFADVGSPYTEGGVIDWLEEEIYDNCQEGSEFGFPSRIDGYNAFGEAEQGAVRYERWAGNQDDPVGADGQFVWEFSGGEWRLRGLAHTCEECSAGGLLSLNYYLNWEMEFDDESLEFQFGQPDSPFVSTAQWLDVGAGVAEQTIDGYMMLVRGGTDCDIAVNYTTVEPLVIEGYETRSEVIASGRMTVDVEGGASFDVEYSNGQVFIDGEPVDPDAPNPCEGAFEIEFTS